MPVRAPFDVSHQKPLTRFTQCCWPEPFSLFPRRPAQRHCICFQLRNAVEEFRFLAARRRPGVRRLRACFGRSSSCSAPIARGQRPIIYFLLLLATWILGFVNALVHAKDAWASMPDGPHPFGRSSPLLAIAATWLGFSTLRAGATTMRRAGVCSRCRPVGPAGRLRQRSGTAAIRPDPQLPEPQRGFCPTMKIANPAEWGDQRPTVPQGYTISAIATDLADPAPDARSSQWRHPGRRRPRRRRAEADARRT